MANELSVSITVAYAKGNVASISRSLSALGITVAGDNFLHIVQAIGTSEEALTLGGVTVAGGVAWVKNLDDTNFIEIRSATGAGNDIIKLKAGEAWIFRWGSDVSAPYAIADTAECDLEYIFWPA